MKQKFKLTLLTLVLCAFAVVPAVAQTSETAKKRANELLAQARIAIGGDATINSVKSLSLAGKVTRSPAAVDMKVEIELDFLFPNKFVKREKKLFAVRDCQSHFRP